MLWSYDVKRCFSSIDLSCILMYIPPGINPIILALVIPLLFSLVAGSIQEIPRR